MCHHSLYPVTCSLLLIKSPVIGGEAQDALDVAASFGKRDALDPVLQVERAARRDPGFGASGAGVVGGGGVLGATELADHLGQVVHAELDVEVRIEQVVGGDAAAAL